MSEQAVIDEASADRLKTHEAERIHPSVRAIVKTLILELRADASPQCARGAAARRQSVERGQRTERVRVQDPVPDRGAALRRDAAGPGFRGRRQSRRRLPACPESGSGRCRVVIPL